MTKAKTLPQQFLVGYVCPVGKFSADMQRATLKAWAKAEKGRSFCRPKGKIVEEDAPKTREALDRLFVTARRGEAIVFADVAVIGTSEADFDRVAQMAEDAGVVLILAETGWRSDHPWQYRQIMQRFTGFHYGWKLPSAVARAAGAKGGQATWKDHELPLPAATIARLWNDAATITEALTSINKAIGRKKRHVGAVSTMYRWIKEGRFKDLPEKDQPRTRTPGRRRST